MTRAHNMTQKIMFNLNHYIVIKYGPLDNLIENTYLKKGHLGLGKCNVRRGKKAYKL